MLVRLYRQSGEGIIAVSLKDAFDLFGGSLEPVPKNEWSKQQDQNVDPRHPACDLHRSQELCGGSRQRSELRRNDQNRGPKCFAAWSRTRRPIELVVGCVQARESVEEHNQTEK